MGARRLLPLKPDRVRRIKGSFGWIDHRFINEGHIRDCTTDEIALYFFLVAVGNKDGLSFWGDWSVSRLLKLNMCRLIQARRLLMEKSLIAYENGMYQVLSLPEPERIGGMESIGKVLQRLYESGR